MANSILFLSSIVMGTIHLFLIPGLPRLYRLAYGVGVVTSINNHLFTILVFKWVDRIWMLFGFLADMLWCLVLGNERCFIILFSYAILYYTSKFYRKKNRDTIADNLHLSSHILATCLHVLIYKNLNSR